MRHLTEAEEALIDQRMSPKETNELLLRLSPIVRRVAQHYSTDEEHAQDLVQECLVHIAVKLSRYREQDAGSVEAWARRVAENLCKSLTRADPVRDYGRHDECREIPDPTPLPDERLARKRRSAVLRAAVKRLAERERAAIELVYLEGLSHHEAARRLGIGAKAVRASVYRGIHRLKRMRSLAVWLESWCDNAVSRAHRCGPDDGRHPVLALQPEPDARDRIRAGMRFGEIDRLLDGVCFATGWPDLRALATRLPGCPVIVDPGCPGSRRSAVEELRMLRAHLPECPIIGHGDIREPWCEEPFRQEIGFVAILQRGAGDYPEAVRLAALQAADREETEHLLDRVRDCVPQDMHRLLDTVLHDSLTRCSVGELAARMRLTARTLARKCRKHRLPTPKRLLSLAIVFHVERLARWSGHGSGPTALALGFSDPANYVHLAKRTLGATPTEVARRGGPDHVARVMLRELACTGSCDPGPSSHDDACSRLR